MDRWVVVISIIIIISIRPIELVCGVDGCLCRHRFVFHHDRFCRERLNFGTTTFLLPNFVNILIVITTSFLYCLALSITDVSQNCSFVLYFCFFVSLHASIMVPIIR